MKISTHNKSFEKMLPEYQKLKESGEILPIKDIENLAKFYGKKGKPLKRKLRSKKAQEEYNEALKKYNKRFGRGAKKRLEKEAKKQTERAEKAVAKSGSNKFGKVAKREVQKQKEAMKTFASSTIKDLRDRLNVGSDTIQFLAVKKGMTEKQIEAYLEDLKAQYDLLPDAAKKLANSDVVNKAIQDLSDAYGEQNVAGALAGYLTGVEYGKEEEALEAIEYFSEHSDETDLTMSEFFDKLKDYNEWNEKNYEEIFDAEKDEDESEED